MYEFCVANFTGVEGEGKMLSCHFIWSKEDLEGFRANTVDDGPSKIKDIRKLHQIITAHKQCNDIFTRDYACLCNGKNKGRAESCHSAESNQHFKYSVELLKAK